MSSVDINDDSSGKLYIWPMFSVDNDDSSGKLLYYIWPMSSVDNDDSSGKLYYIRPMSSVDNDVHQVNCIIFDQSLV